MFLAQIETAIKVVDQASAASDRWLFLGALGIIIVGGSMCIRWLVSSLVEKDKQHEVSVSQMRSAHAAEREEWRKVLGTQQAEFTNALEKQQAAFRAELSEERHQCAQERTLDREARHATANALNTVGLFLQEHREVLMQANNKNKQ